MFFCVLFIDLVLQMENFSFSLNLLGWPILWETSLNLSEYIQIIIQGLIPGEFLGVKNCRYGFAMVKIFFAMTFAMEWAFSLCFSLALAPIQISAFAVQSDINFNQLRFRLKSMVKKKFFCQERINDIPFPFSCFWNSSNLKIYNSSILS